MEAQLQNFVSQQQLGSGSPIPGAEDHCFCLHSKQEIEDLGSSVAEIQQKKIREINSLVNSATSIGNKSEQSSSKTDHSYFFQWIFIVAYY